jgi:choline dehydrogenase
MSAARAFLRPNLGRQNLTLLLKTRVTKVTLSGTKCTGVELVIDGETRTIGADREVVLTAGGVGSAKLLMLSGIGDPSALRPLGIDPVVGLPGVGQNYQDHVLLSGVAFEYKGKMPDRPVDSNAVEAKAHLASGIDDSGVDIALILEQVPAVTPDAAAKFGAPTPNTFVIAPALIQPESRGSIKLASANWRDPIVIEGNYLKADRDMNATVRAVELARELGSQAAFDKVRTREIVPGPNATKEDIREFVSLAAGSFGHPVGTCKMGTDDMTVVDPELRVRGVSNLRVADSSVIPRIPTAPTNAASFMVGGKAAFLLGA